MNISSSLHPSNVAAQCWPSSESSGSSLSISRAQYSLSIVHVWMILNPICEYSLRASREEHRIVGIWSRSLIVVTAPSSNLPIPRLWALGSTIRRLTTRFVAFSAKDPGKRKRSRSDCAKHTSVATALVDFGVAGIFLLFPRVLKLLPKLDQMWLCLRPACLERNLTL